MSLMNDGIHESSRFARVKTETLLSRVLLVQMMYFCVSLDSGLWISRKYSKYMLMENCPFFVDSKSASEIVSYVLLFCWLLSELLMDICCLCFV
uniref:Uncharacterized protein n=1 Tax=Anopheles dirus TaxID=7168 RepID=A0A182NYF6_9DIPT